MRHIFHISITQWLDNIVVDLLEKYEEMYVRGRIHVLFSPYCMRHLIERSYAIPYSPLLPPPHLPPWPPPTRPRLYMLPF
jgi:hypothetical protein